MCGFGRSRFHGFKLFRPCGFSEVLFFVSLPTCWEIPEITDTSIQATSELPKFLHLFQLQHFQDMLQEFLKVFVCVSWLFMEVNFACADDTLVHT